MKKKIFMVSGLAVLAAGLISVVVAFTTNFQIAADSSPPEQFTRSVNLAPPAAYTVKKGDTIYDIARQLGIPYYDLVIENRLTGEWPLAVDAILKLPVFSKIAQPANVPRVTIAAGFTQGPAPLAITLNSDFNFADVNLRYVWDLGDNRFSFQARPGAFYIRPGIYHPRLIVLDQAGRYASSDSLTVTVTDLPAEYEGLPYLTVDRVGDFVDVTGRLKNAARHTVDFDENATMTQSPALLDYFGKNRLIARAEGFSRVRLENRDYVFEFYLFVSPLPARLSVEPEYDWYKTQYNTGMYGNCGPAAIDSAIKWATGKDFPVETIRAEIGMPYKNGAVDHRNLLGNLQLHAAPAEILPIGSARDIMAVIDRGGLAIVSFNCGKIRRTRLDVATDYYDRYYPDATGHYLLIKGYSLDRKYFIVYDAIPGEWKKNEPRYRDGVSMIGRNRFFLTDEVMAGIGTRTMLVVFRNVSSNAAVGE